MAHSLALHDHLGGTVLSLRGEIDLAVAEELRNALDAATAAGDVEVCLHAVTFLDCRAIGVLAVAHGAAARRGRRVTVVRPTGFVLRMLQITGDLPLLSPPAGLPQPQPQPEPQPERCMACPGCPPSGSAVAADHGR